MPPFKLTLPTDRPHAITPANPPLPPAAGIPNWPPQQNPPQMSRHHVIPWSKFKFFWDWVIDNSKSITDELVETIGANLQAYLPNLTWTSAEEQNFRNLATAWPTYTHDPNPNAPEPPHFDRLVEILCWLPANIFLGPVPEARRDDPGDGFEYGSRWTVIAPPLSAREFHVRHQAFVIIDLFNAPLAAPPTVSDAVRGMLRVQQTAAGRHACWPWTPNAWIYYPAPPPPAGAQIDTQLAMPMVWQAGSEVGRAGEAAVNDDQPMRRIVIGGTEISLDVVDRADKERRYSERGTAQGISLDAVVDWTKGFGGDFPADLSDVQIDKLVVEVTTSPGRQHVKLIVAPVLDLSGIKVRSVLQFTCTRLKSGKETIYGFSLNALVGFPVGGEGAEMWLDGHFSKSMQGRWSLSLSWGTEGSGVQALPVFTGDGTGAGPTR
ncbi:hypothetical protein [Streptomyces sp. URMC 129]|uniref:hypothetical protein n=1 Tax=Streptomyces sp. URMC 129 TaxID=3423407 RepID=UPI003F1ABF26